MPASHLSKVAPWQTYETLRKATDASCHNDISPSVGIDSDDVNGDNDHSSIVPECVVSVYRPGRPHPPNNALPRPP